MSKKKNSSKKSRDTSNVFIAFDTIQIQELKQAFIDLGFAGQNKFVYQILAELD